MQCRIRVVYFTYTHTDIQSSNEGTCGVLVSGLQAIAA